MKYPEQLCRAYGAKAGILMYVAQELPDIPQAAMVVKTPAESIDGVLKRADEAQIRWPRLFRSSALAELDGHEGKFLTEWMQGFKEGKASVINPFYVGPYSDRSLFDGEVKAVIKAVEESPRWLKQKGKRHANLPDRICVIIAQESPSRYFGTFIKHPHQDEFYIMTISEGERNFNGRMVNQLKSTYSYKPEEGALPFKLFNQQGIDDNSAIRKDLEAVVSWHDRIASLPLMDNGWAYQLEFGINPPCLYQVRPFKPKAKASFKIEPADKLSPSVAVGITPPDGINVRVETVGPLDDSPEPFVFFDKLTNARLIEDSGNYEPKNHQANIFHNALGMLAHDDIRLMRIALVSGFFLFQPVDVKRGDWVNIVSDGLRINVRKIAAP